MSSPTNFDVVVHISAGMVDGEVFLPEAIQSGTVSIDVAVRAT